MPLCSFADDARDRGVVDMGDVRKQMVGRVTDATGLNASASGVTLLWQRSW